MMPPWLRKLSLTVHILSSVGWFGAVAGFLALALVGLTPPDPGTAGAAYRAMEVTGWAVIVPLGLASLLSGVVQALGTPWGVFRHYWVLIKLLITLLATLLLLVHMQPVGRVAGAAAEGALSSGDLREVRTQLVADAAAALVALGVATVLSVYKPRGLTRYGRRKRREERSDPSPRLRDPDGSGTTSGSR